MPAISELTVNMNRDAIDFEKESVFTLFRRLLIPTLLGSMALSAVSTIDGIFVGHGVGANGVAAVNIVVPIYQVMAGLGFMVGAGCSVVASIHLSRKNAKVARINVSQALLFASLVSVLVIAAVEIFPEWTARLLGASETLLPDVVDYLRWIMPAFLFEIWSLIGLFIIRLDGAPKYAMWCNMVPAFMNVVLDWLFIFPLGMGVKGAAIATAISITAGGLMAIMYLLFFARTMRLASLKVSRTSVLLAIRNIGYQCRIGSSSLLGEMIMAVFIFVGNWQFMSYLGDTGVGAFGIACYYAPFFFMIGNAIAQAAQPIISYNFGAERLAFVIEARNLLLRTAIAFGFVVSALFMLFPKALTGLFVDVQSPAGILSIEGMPYFGAGALFYILNIALIGYYQSIKKIRKSTVFMLLRGFIILIPMFFLLPIFAGTPGIWLAMPVSEILTTVVIYMSWRIGRKTDTAVIS